MSLLKNFLDAAKGSAVSLAGKKFLSSYLEKYGQMLNFSVQPDTKKITAEILLKGEASPIHVTLDGYEIDGPAGKPTLRVARVSASREWLEVVLREFVEGKPIDLPPKAAPLLKLLL